MGKKEILEVLVDGGAAKAGAAMGTKLGPLGVNINDILVKINEETKDFSGMKVPVKIIVDIETKNWEITVGTPPTSQLILSELNIQKGSGKPNEDFVGDLSLEQLEKIAKMKIRSSLSKDIKKVMREVAGTCVSMGVKINGKLAKEYLQKA